MRRIVNLAACAVASVATLCMASAAAADRVPSAQRGGQLFRTVGCVHCHGSSGQGSVAGARLAPNPLPAAAIAQVLRSTATNMPTYSVQELGDADVADIAAYLASIPPPKAPDAIPALRAVRLP